MVKYNPSKIERKWQKKWEEKGIFKADDRSKKPKFYALVEFPYPSGEGLHVGHCRSYVGMDVIARKRRMQGYNVLYPMGWDAFGLPTENYAIKTGIHPAIATKKNTLNFKRQQKKIGLSFDWSREINTTDPKYYKWTQWIFLQLFDKGLAYESKIPINWCPSCKIGLANEEVINGKCERCGTRTKQRLIKQWMLGITRYADKLIQDLDSVDYSDKIKTQQIEWIGKSEGVEVWFNTDVPIVETIKVFTTRVDTIFGVTAIVLAPEYDSLLNRIVWPKYRKQVIKYIEQAKLKNEFERTKLEKEKTGVFTGSYCINPVNGEKIPIWVGDYVVATYGGGAVMLVPAHDKRDYAFAKKYGLEIKEVVSGGDISKQAFVDYGTLINSGQFSGLKSGEAIKKITNWIEQNTFGQKKTNYKLRDWVFSRQHYWGEPIPIIHCQKCGPFVPVPEKDLPVKLPDIKDYKPTDKGESPLKKAEKWLNVKCPKCKGPGKRETDVMPNWAGSNWYFLRYCDSNNDNKLAKPELLKKWMPVDWYNGGMEHTTLHLLYSRFIYKFLWDIGAVPKSIGPEPYKKRTSHGIVLGEGSIKMSKSKGNVINPEDIIDQYGADTLRVYEMFMGPFEQMIPWDAKGVRGVRRFLEKVWKMRKKVNNESRIMNNGLNVLTNKTIKKVGEDIEQLKFNTAISALMILANEMEKQKNLQITDYKLLITLLNPFAPHITEELWQGLGLKGLCSEQKWPEYDKKLIKEKKLTLVVQINGKIRAKIEVDAGISEKQVKELALKNEKIKKWTKGKKINKIIFVKDKLINFVII